MATPAESEPSENKNVDRRMSLGKYVKRMSSVFKREKSTKSLTSPTSATPQAQAQHEPAKEEVAQEEAVAAPTTTTQAPAQESTTSPPAPTSDPQVLDRRAMQQERARALFAKYGLTLESHEWIAAPAPIPTVQRVEKSIRMRVHRSCHRCGTIYGADKVCLKCEHRRCKKCPRYPKKKTAEEKQKDKDTTETPRKKKAFTIKTRSGGELVFDPPKQRVRRSCHKCHTLFIPATATVCEQCHHVRCTTCPREPAKLAKWPTGYPGDADADADSDSEVEKQLEKFRRTWRKPRARVRWECEQCHGLFVNGSPQCPGCGHERCDKCTRTPIKKAKKEEQFDPHIVAAVEAKLRALGVDDPAAPGPEAA
ncbi:uncharacterized protein K460DRAFT_367605 [Cucurbitaria berberidis CBS 394.84]|uniref:Uncharacterized protein n=1 Tax=Cucurbitaria berberidis CBS 394.84 TaxID=1168544 RepID=A0A9P4GKM5_9PLEO|nr:uncharacterized protein K460DRAFT_367605 [Cucurbitaria berberidis CBS 394.84]KAF1846851.1 hypothetical protein K460DRAFT_367605 [Cucurbitaria berberidis CBS 394.84]